LNLDLPKVKRGYVCGLMTFRPEWRMIPGQLPQVRPCPSTPDCFPA
jgi:hypothetical protein